MDGAVLRLPRTTAFRGVRPAALLIVGWAAIGLLAGVSQYLGFRFGGSSRTLADAVEGPLVAALLWVPISVVAIRLGRQPGAGTPGWMAAVLLLAAGSSLVLNCAFQAVYWLLPGAEARWERVLADAFLFLPFNAGAFVGIVAITRWWEGRSRERSRSDLPGSGPAEPEAPAPLLDVKVGAELLRLPVEDIGWLEARGDYVRVHAAGRAHLVTGRMDEFDRILGPSGFVRIHRSTIVNVRRVRSLSPRSHGDGDLTLDDGTALRVTRSRRAELLRWMDGRR